MFLEIEGLEAVQKSFPALAFSPDKTKIIGEISFSAYYDGEKLHIDPAHAPKSQKFNGYYEIEIRLNDLDPHYHLPKVIETGGKLRKFSIDRRISLSDLHLNADIPNNGYYCCLGIFKPEELKVMTFYTFFMECVLSFFAWQAYLSFFMRKPPWGEYSHGKLGEWEKEKEIQKETGRNNLCPCGSGKKFKNCCMKSNKTSIPRKN